MSNHTKGSSTKRRSSVWYLRYGEVKRYGVLMGIDLPDNEPVLVYYNDAGAIYKIVWHEDNEVNHG